MGMETESRIELLHKIDAFSSLSLDELAVIAGVSETQNHRKGGTVFEQDGGGGRIFVIREGEVLIKKKMDDDREISLATFVEGESFGELSLFEDRSSGTSAHAETDVRLLVFPASGSSSAETFEEYPDIGAKILYSLLVKVAGRIRSTNKLVAENSPWVQELRRQVITDKLTRLYNSSYLEEEFGRKFDAEPGLVSILIVKPDNFKVINDTFGHDAGDGTLRLMASAIRTLINEGDIPVRYHGDVFAVVLPGTGPRRARQVAREIAHAISTIDLSEVVNDTSNLTLTVSVGIAAYSKDGATCAELLDRANQNMLTARNRGGDRAYRGQSTNAGES